VENFRREKKKGRREREKGETDTSVETFCSAGQHNCARRYASSLRFILPHTFVFLLNREKSKSRVRRYVNRITMVRLLLIFFFEQRYPAWRWTSATRMHPASTRNRWQSACAIQDTRATEQRAVPSVLPLSLLSFFINFCFASFARITFYEAHLERDFLSSILRSRSVFTATHTYRLLCICRISI